MEDFLELFKKNDDITPVAMVARTVVVFLIGVALVRISGKRSFSMNVSMDNVITLLIGGILSRGVDGRIPFLGVILAAVTIVAMYKILNWACLYNIRLGRLVKGESVRIYKNGQFNIRQMKRSMITEADVIERIRASGHQDNYENIEEMYLERDGGISFIKKEET